MHYERIEIDFLYHHITSYFKFAMLGVIVIFWLWDEYVRK